MARECFVEAIVLSKFWNDQTSFVKALKELYEQLQKENKLQQMAKVSKALEKLQENVSKAEEQDLSVKESCSLISQI